MAISMPFCFIAADAIKICEYFLCWKWGVLQVEKCVSCMHSTSVWRLRASFQAEALLAGWFNMCTLEVPFLSIIGGSK